MIKTIMEKGFSALTAYTFVLSLVMSGLFVAAIIANACTKNSKFNTSEIRKVLLINLCFMTVFAVLDYLLVP